MANDLRSPRSVDEIAADVRRLGVRAGDLLMVHVSLRRVGPIVGGADGLIDALEAAVGPTGTLLVNTGVRDDWGWVNERPEAERAPLLADAEPFDAETTPADPDNGVFAEVFRARGGTVVSDHPEGRFGARGAQAAALVANVPWHDYYGPGSPLERAVDMGGRILRLGADPDTVTMLHYAEYLAAVPDKRRVRRHRLVHAPGGPQIRVIETLDDSDGIVDTDDDYFTTILHAYLATGRAAVGTVGGARSELIDAADLVAFGAAWMTDNLVAEDA